MQLHQSLELWCNNVRHQVIQVVINYYYYYYGVLKCNRFTFYKTTYSYVRRYPNQVTRGRNKIVPGTGHESLKTPNNSFHNYTYYFLLRIIIQFYECVDFQFCFAVSPFVFAEYNRINLILYYTQEMHFGNS